VLHCGPSRYSYSDICTLEVQGHGVIAKSDIIILVLASSLLAVGVNRWSGNLQAAEAGMLATNQQSIPVPTIQTPAPTVVASLDTQQATEPALPVVAVAPAAPTAVSVPADNPVNAYGVHTVSSGEYLGLIAQQYSTTVATLRAINELDGNLILVGQELQYPLPSP